MTRTVEATICGTVYSMPVGFAASMKVHEHEFLGDPFKLSTRLAEGERLTLKQVIAIITIGVRCAGCQLEDEAIGDDIIDRGAQDFILPAAKYVVSLVSGSPALPVLDGKKKQKQNQDATLSGLQ